MNTRLELLIPRFAEALLSCDAVEVRRIENHLARGDRLLRDWPGYERQLAASLGLELATAAAAMPAAVLAPATLGDALLRADPVHLRADVARLRLVDGASIDIREDEAAALRADLNAALGEDGFALHAGIDPAHWILCGGPSAAIEIPPATMYSGQALEPTFDDMQRDGALKRIVTECQMVLHEHEVNQARAARGAPPINSVWLCGAGTATADAGQAPGSVTADHALPLAAADFARVPGTRSDNGRDAVSAALATDAHAALIVCSPALQPESATFAAEVTLAALDALAAGRAQGVDIVSDIGCWQLARSQRWRLWRRPERGFLLREPRTDG